MKLDLEKIKNNLSNKDIIKIMTEKLGADRYKDDGKAIIFPTICHNENAEDASLKLYYYKENKRFHCYTECDKSYDIFRLFQKVYRLHGKEINIFQIAQEITGYNLNLFFTESNQYKSKRNKYRHKQSPELTIYKDNVLNSFIKHYPIEWLIEGISTKAMDKFNILYSISREQIIIPHYNIDKKLIGIRGRTTNDEIAELYGKYVPVKVGDILYNHPLSLNLYGIGENKEDLKNANKIIIYEGEKSVLKHESYFQYNNSVAACGSSINKRQIDLILRNFPNINEVIIAFDKEYSKNGDKRSEIYFNKLYNLGEKYSNYFNFSFIFDKENLLREKDSPIDKGKDNFLKLFKDRVRVRSV